MSKSRFDSKGACLGAGRPGGFFISGQMLFPIRSNDLYVIFGGWASLRLAFEQSTCYFVPFGETEAGNAGVRPAQG